MQTTQRLHDLISLFMGASYAGAAPTGHSCEAVVAWQTQSLKRVAGKIRGMGLGVTLPEGMNLDTHSDPSDLPGIWGINPDIMLARGQNLDAQLSQLQPEERHIHLPLLMTYVVAEFRATKVNVIGEYTIRTASRLGSQHLVLAFDTQSDSRPYFRVSLVEPVAHDPLLSIGAMQFLAPL